MQDTMGLNITLQFKAIVNKTVWYWHAAAAAKSLQLCPTLCNLIDGSPPGSPVPGILQARTLEWIAISFSNAGKWKVKVKSLSHVRLFANPWTAASQNPKIHGIFQARVLEWGAILLTLDLSISGRNRFFFSPAVFKAFFFLCFSLGDSAYTQCKNSGLRRAFANTSEIKEFMKGP